MPFAARAVQFGDSVAHPSGAAVSSCSTVRTTTARSAAVNAPHSIGEVHDSNLAPTCGHTSNKTST
jgi:hypothetical protein